MKVVSLKVWSNPAYMKANERERLEVIFCNYEGECKSYNQGKCVCQDMIFGGIWCPHSKVKRETGLTTRARGFGKLANQWKEQYKTDVKINSDFIAECGDYIFIPMNFLDVYGDKVVREIEKSYFIPKQHFNIENIHRIVNAVPRALMGGIITKYQSQEVPKFIRQLREFNPELYKDYLEKYPSDKEWFESICGNYIGRKAYLKTLNDGAIYIDCHNNKWVKESEYLVCYEYKTWLAIGKEKRICKQQIMGDEIVKITSNDFVSSETVFVD